MPARESSGRMPFGRLHAPVTVLGKLVTALVVVALVAAGIVFWPRQAQTSVSADFTRAVGLYPGSDVRILGVKVGQSDSLTPEGDHVHVTFSYDDKYRVPASAEAGIVAPSPVLTQWCIFAFIVTDAPSASASAFALSMRSLIP